MNNFGINNKEKHDYAFPDATDKDSGFELYINMLAEKTLASMQQEEVGSLSDHTFNITNLLNNIDEKIVTLFTQELDSNSPNTKFNQWYKTPELPPLTSQGLQVFSQDYSHHPSLPSAVSEFSQDLLGINQQHLVVKQMVAEQLGLHLSHLTLKKITPGLTTGSTTSSVFLIQFKKSGHLCCVVKTFSEDEACNEINASKKMNEQQFHKCHFPKIMGVGHVKQENGKRLYLLALSPASGQSLDQILSETLHNFRNREEALLHLKQCFSHVGKALAEFHKVAPQAIVPSNSFSNTIEIAKSKAESMASQIENASENKELGEIIRNQIERVSFLSPPSFVHHDFHIGNIFLDQKDQLTFIDNSDIQLSIGKEGEPCGIAAKDVATFLTLFPIMAGLKYQLSPSEIEELSTQFLESYLQKRPQNIHTLLPEINFMKAYVLSECYLKIKPALDDPSHPFASFGKENLNNLLNYITTSLKQLPS